MNESDLRDILDTMNLPEERRDIREPFNVRWLSRNEGPWQQGSIELPLYA